MRPSASPPPAGRQRRRGRRISPIWVILGVAVVGSVAFSLYALTIRDESQVPMLAAGSLVVALAFGAVAVIGVATAYRAARDGRNGSALGAALIGGVAAMIALGALALATVLGQIWGGTGSAL
jgi:FtsH-binding integral membrane protein